jgi:hypothetical protein
MRIRNFCSPAALLLAGLAASTSASADLIVRSGGMVYDTDRNITWLQDANYAFTSGYDSDGKMTWDAAVAWADQLIYGGSSNWRLPKSTDPNGNLTSGTNNTGSEMGHLFYTELGATANSSILSGNATQLAKFTNIISNAYWTTPQEPSNSSWAWAFFTYNGDQYPDQKTYEWYAWAVADGDIAPPLPPPSTIPELDATGAPLALTMLAGALALTRRRG